MEFHNCLTNSFPSLSLSLSHTHTHIYTYRQSVVERRQARIGGDEGPRDRGSGQRVPEVHSADEAQGVLQEHQGHLLPVLRVPRVHSAGALCGRHIPVWRMDPVRLYRCLVASHMMKEKKKRALIIIIIMKRYVPFFPSLKFLCFCFLTAHNSI